MGQMIPGSFKNGLEGGRGYYINTKGSLRKKLQWLYRAISKKCPRFAKGFCFQDFLGEKLIREGGFGGGGAGFHMEKWVPKNFSINHYILQVYFTNSRDSSPDSRVNEAYKIFLSFYALGAGGGATGGQCNQERLTIVKTLFLQEFLNHLFLRSLRLGETELSVMVDPLFALLIQQKSIEMFVTRERAQ